MRTTGTHNATVITSKERACDRRGFTLLEVLASLVILAFVSSSVLLVINRSIASAADSAFRMEAFKLARENMEALLSANSVGEMVEYGASEHYPDMTWRTVVETFSEPATSQMWVRAVCSAEFTDSKGERQTVELVNWLSQLTEQQANQLTQDEGQDLNALAVDQLIEYVETAAQYARVDAETIEQWLENGLVTTPDGAFIKYNLDIFIRNEGNPSNAEKAQQVATIEELAMVLTGAATGDAGAGDTYNPTAGMSEEERDGVER